MMGLLRKGQLATPSWLNPLACSAQVEVNCLSFLESVLNPEDGSPGLKAVIDSMTGMPSHAVIQNKHLLGS